MVEGARTPRHGRRTRLEELEELRDAAVRLHQIRSRTMEAMLLVAAVSLAITAVALGLDEPRSLLGLVFVPLATFTAWQLRTGAFDLQRVEVTVAVLVTATFLGTHALESGRVAPGDLLGLLDTQFREFRVLAPLVLIGFYVFRTRTAWAWSAGICAALALIRLATVGFTYPAQPHVAGVAALVAQLATFLAVLSFFASTTDWLGEGRARLDGLLAERRRIQAAAAHDIVGPLGAASGLVRTVVDRPQLDGARAETLLRGATSSIDRVIGIAQDLLRDVGIADVEEATPVHLPTLVRRSVEQSRLRAEPVDLVVPPVTAVLPEHAVTRALVNLLDNAHKHGAPPVRVEVAVTGNTTAFAVRDGGPGLPSEGDGLFAPFVRGTSDAAGSGLGLYVVREIADSYGGTARAVPSDVGACIELTLPSGTA